MKVTIDLMNIFKEDSEGKTIDSSIQSDPLGKKTSTERMTVRNITAFEDQLGSEIRGNGNPVKYKSSEYVASFMGKPEGNIPFKEDKRMSVMEQLMERAELTNTRGTVGIGKEDEVLGAPNSKDEDPIEDGMTDVQKNAEKLDSEADTVDKQNELFGDKEISGKKTAEGVMISTKQEYATIVDAMITHLIEMSLLSHVNESFVGTPEYDNMLEGYVCAVMLDKAPTGWGMMEEATKKFLAERILYFKESREKLLSTPTKRSASLVEEYYTDAVQLLSDIPASVTARALSARS